VLEQAFAYWPPEGVGGREKVRIFGEERESHQLKAVGAVGTDGPRSPVVNKKQGVRGW
jgi:hypothetical protein